MTRIRTYRRCHICDQRSVVDGTCVACDVPAWAADTTVSPALRRITLTACTVFLLSAVAFVHWTLGF